MATVFEETQGETVAVVHTVGSLLESANYKSFLDPINNLVGGGPRNESLFQSSSAAVDYATVNTETLASVARVLSSTPQIGQSVQSQELDEKTPMLLVSAYASPPLVSPKYIDSKRDAEEILFSCANLRPTVLRPGFLYSDERDWSMVVAGVLNLSSRAKGFVPQNPLGLMVQSMLPPELDMDFLAQPPMRVETLADAIVQGILDEECYGIVEGSSEINALAHR